MSKHTREKWLVKIYEEKVFFFFVEIWMENSEVNKMCFKSKKCLSYVRILLHWWCTVWSKIIERKIWKLRALFYLFWKILFWSNILGCIVNKTDVASYILGSLLHRCFIHNKFSDKHNFQAHKILLVTLHKNLIFYMLLFIIPVFYCACLYVNINF